MIRILFAVLVLAMPTGVWAKTLLVLGDSLSAGYGLADVSEGWVSQLQKKLADGKLDYTIANESISGDTSAGGLARIDAALAKHKPSILILELGGNDGLFGLPPDQMKSNLIDIISRAKKQDAKVLLLAMRIPPNYGKRYTDLFYKVYLDVAKQTHIPVTPFILEDIALVKDLMQNDGIHPNAKAGTLIVDKIWPHLQPLITEQR